ncbi:uncharacterized protein ATC70_008252 [Mucor velutinosus]|uniref:AMP-dependent synthetase/ligase domain-containing protein n=1 Tax=Mucor velutinosus TaxID=708070 RepID=A0AAN7DNC6_9FUNG|nr:hypothetical protein ATC70_008252 [Mucor velutinosus]
MPTETSSFQKLSVKYNKLFALINVFEKQVEKYADQVYGRYYGRLDNSVLDHKTLWCSDVDRIGTSLACECSSKIKGYDIVAFIADQSVQYFLCFFACLKLRITFLALSPRNSEAVVVNLLEKSDCRFIFSTTKYAALAQRAAAQVDGTVYLMLPPLNLTGRIK